MVALLYTTQTKYTEKDFQSFYKLILLYNDLKNQDLKDLENVTFTFVNLEEVDEEEVRQKKLDYFKSTSGEQRFIKYFFNDLSVRADSLEPYMEESPKVLGKLLMKLPNRYITDDVYKEFRETKREDLHDQKVSEEDIDTIIKKYEELLNYDYCTEQEWVFKGKGAQSA